MVTFHTTILRGGKNTTGIEVPAEMVEALGSSRRPAVTVTVNGYSYRSTVATAANT
jgi:antitoxin component of MazEF toxin-antitoxin module